MSTVHIAELFQQNTDLELMELLIPFIMNRSFLDIGAAKGEFTRFFAAQGLKGHFFEPLPHSVSELTLLAQETGCVFFPYAIDSYDHMADFYQAYDKADNDVQHFSSLVPLQNDARIIHKKVSSVQCKSLDSLLAEGLISQHIGVIKVDTEGNDLNVLKGMNQVKTDILMCEFFMPEIYAGWEQGHPVGLIKQAQQLGFHHYVSIERIGDFETISLNNQSFIDKQWGNIIFIADDIFARAKKNIDVYLEQKRSAFMREYLLKYSALQKTCDERLEIINGLKQACDERLELINKLTEAVNQSTSSSIKAVKQKMKSLI